MTSDQSWGEIVSDIMKENGVSERRLAAFSNVNRSSLRKFLAGRDRMALSDVIKILSTMGYDLDAVRVRPHDHLISTPAHGSGPSTLPPGQTRDRMDREKQLRQEKRAKLQGPPKKLGPKVKFRFIKGSTTDAA